MPEVTRHARLGFWTGLADLLIAKIQASRASLGLSVVADFQEMISIGEQIAVIGQGPRIPLPRSLHESLGMGPAWSKKYFLRYVLVQMANDAAQIQAGYTDTVALDAEAAEANFAAYTAIAGKQIQSLLRCWQYFDEHYDSDAVAAFRACLVAGDRKLAYDILQSAIHPEA